MVKRIRVIAIVLACCMATGCTLFPRKAQKANVDGPPLVHKDVSKVPNAVPKVEPKSRYGNPKNYVVFGKKYHVMQSSHDYKATGTASWYGRKFHGRKTSSGEPYDMFAMTAAHKTLPLPTYAKVKNLKNGKEIIVKINDRGPFVGDRLIDLSYTAAKKLGIYDTGTGKVQITAINPRTFYKNNAPVVASKPSALSRPAYIQLGAFKNKNNADKLASQAKSVTDKWEKVVVSVLTPITNADLYKVRVGPLLDDSVLNSLKNELTQLSLAELNIVFD